MIEPHGDSAFSVSRRRPRRFSHDAMACTFEVRAIEEDAEYARQAADAAFAELDRLEQELSRFVPTSDIARINSLRSGQHVHVGADTIACLRLAARVFADTGGAFDVAFASRQALPPGIKPLELDPRERTITVRADGVQIDLGGIGKGYALDRMLEILRDWRIRATLVHCGQSTVAVLGRPQETADWLLGIRNPLKPDQVLGRVRLRDAALSGSGRALHGDHIIDPHSGQAALDKLGAWALAPSAALADALSTAFMVMADDDDVAACCQRQAHIGALLCAENAGVADLRRFGEVEVVTATAESEQPGE